MADSTDEEHADIPKITQQEIPSEESIPAPAPVTNPIQETEQPETQNSKPETASMEVHKHPHHVTHKKKWGEYLLEFLMLFLAVFLGFVAENIRENYVAHKSAKEY